MGIKARLGERKVLAVVPARGGSVGIPRKNLTRVGGLTLIARVANVVRQLPWITKAILSTDDSEMRREGLEHGLECPFMRPVELARSDTSGPAVLYHAWTEAERYFQTKFDYALYLEPTSPLRLPAEIEKTLAALIESECDSAVTVSPSPAHFAPEKCLLRKENGILNFYVSEGLNVHARQNLPTYYHRNGVAYAVRREAFFKNRKILTADNTLAIVLERPLVNIDEPFEIELAEWLLTRSLDNTTT